MSHFRIAKIQNLRNFKKKQAQQNPKKQLKNLKDPCKYIAEPLRKHTQTKKT